MKTRQLIQELKEEIEKLEKDIDRGEYHFTDCEEQYEKKKSQLQFAKKLIKAIKEDIEELKYNDDTNEFYKNILGTEDIGEQMVQFTLDKINKILDEELE